MDYQIKERCIYCGGDVYYTGREKLIKCSWCGQTLVVAKFENELARLYQALEEGKKAKRDLSDAEKAKREAEEHLLRAIDSLDDIQSGQDVLSLLMKSVMASQKTAEGKLGTVMAISERILKNQGDLFEGMGILGEIKGQLQNIGMDEKAVQNYARDFIAWFQGIHSEDISRLEQVASQSSQIMQEQKEISDKIDRLSQAADKTQKTLDEFHSQWKESQLEELRQLYQQAEGFQHDRVYDKAESYYRQIITKGGADAEVYWRLLLCYYCVSYQQSDEGKGELIPIILNPDLTAPEEMSLRREFTAQIKEIPEEQKAVYEEELSKIDRILDKYRLICGSVSYDVFISVKQQRDGNPTKDSFAAVTLFKTLSDKGLKVFNSRLTPPPAGQEYEPYIISALMSAKAMIVVGSCRENMESQWIKNEWSRFQWLQRGEMKRTGKTDRVLLCYLTEGMKPEDIPRGLNPNRQAIKADITADRQLDQALAFMLPEKRNPAKAEPAEVQSTAEQTISQMTTWLYRKRFDKVLEKYESLTDSGLHLNQAQVHLCALCAEKQASSIDEVVESDVDLAKEPLFRLALRVSQGTDEYLALKSMLDKNSLHLEKLDKNTLHLEKGASYTTVSGGKTPENEVHEIEVRENKFHEKEERVPVESGNDPEEDPIQDEPRKKPKKLPVIPVIIGVALIILAAWGFGKNIHRGSHTGSSEIESAGEDYAIDWKDENLEQAIREKTGVFDRKIMYSDVKDITSLNLNSKEISDISGLESMTNLTKLSVIHNKVSDISSLSKLTNLTELGLSGNEISDISVLANLTNLSKLWLNHNKIYDISSLKYLESLTELFLSGNEISDITDLAGLMNLTELGLSGNKISDINCLASMTNLKTLWVYDNNISDFSLVEKLPNLVLITK